MSYPYPQGLIKMTAGFIKNDPQDKTVMGVSNDNHGGFKVVGTIAEMLTLHPNYLAKDYTACLVASGNGGKTEIFFLSSDPSNANSTLIGDWTKFDIDLITGGGVSFKGLLNPASYTIADNDSNEDGDFYIVNTVDPYGINDVNLFAGENPVLESTDWVIKSSGRYFHMDLTNVVKVTWNTMTGKPQVIINLEQGILPSHNHGGNTIEVNHLVNGQTIQYLSGLLSLIVYTNSIAESSGTAQGGQLLTLSQISDLFVSKTSLNTDITSVVTNVLSAYMTTAAFNSEISNYVHKTNDVIPDIDLVGNEDAALLIRLRHLKGYTYDKATIDLKVSNAVTAALQTVEAAYDTSAEVDEKISVASQASAAGITGEVDTIAELFALAGGDIINGDELTTGDRIVAKDPGDNDLRKAYKFTGGAGDSGPEYWIPIYNVGDVFGEAPLGGDYVRRNKAWALASYVAPNIATIYVDTHLGNDTTGEGTMAKPFLTLQAALNLRITTAYTIYAVAIICTGRAGSQLGDFNIVLTDILYPTLITQMGGCAGEDGYMVEANHGEVTDAEKGLIFHGVGVDQLTLHQTLTNTNLIVFDTVRSVTEFVAGTIADHTRIQISAEFSNIRIDMTPAGALSMMADWNIFLHKSILEFRDSSITSITFNKLKAKEGTIISRYNIPLTINFSNSETVNPVESLRIEHGGNVTISSTNSKPLAIDLFLYNNGIVTWGNNTDKRLVTEGVKDPPKFVTLTQAEYDAIGTPDPLKFYFITE